LGINLGRLGFLIQIDRKEWREYFEKLFNGEAWIENRMMLHADHMRAGEQIGTWNALNEVVVGRGQLLRPVRLTALVDGRELTSYVADGLIAATATGSTAYALAAGGPILPPELRNILLVPIAPHLSVDRAVVLSEGSSVTIKVRGENAVISVDGQPPTPLMEDDLINVHAADVTAQFVRFGDPGYFYRNLTAHMNQNSLGFPR
jgi:NAD+ kinase